MGRIRYSIIAIATIAALLPATSARAQFVGEPPAAIFSSPSDPIFDPFVRRSEFVADETATTQLTGNPAEPGHVDATGYAPAAGPNVSGPSQCGPCDCARCRRAPCECPTKPAPCIPCPHVSTLLPFWNVHIFGALQGNVLFNTSRPIAPGIPLLLAPGSPEQENTVDVFARSSALGAAFTGPEIGTMQAGGVVLCLFYNDALIVDRYGLLPLQAYGDLKNEDWRLAAGLQFNVFAPNTPTMLTFGSMLGSGNAGNNFVGQFRVERFLHPSADSDWTIQAAISDPVATGVVSNTPISVLITGGPALRITEDNGWPTLEGRIAYATGKKSLVGMEQKRAFETGLSVVGGQLRSVLVPQPNVVANTYGVCSDFRWSVSDRFGMVGEAFIGEGLGFQNAGILQSVNSATFRGIRTRGAWGEIYYYLNPCLHTHWGGGIDDPRDQDIAVTQVTRNTTLFSNVIWDVTKQLRFGVEFTYRETNYVALNDNHGAGFHFQTQWSF